MNPIEQDTERAEEHMDSLVKSGVIKEYNVYVKVSINGKEYGLAQTFFHNTLDTTAHLWNDSVALEIGEKVEQVIKDNNMLF
jgi:hypothetical protein